MHGRRGVRTLGWLSGVVATVALFAACSHDPPMVGGSVTEVRRDGRVCIEVERREARPRALCGSWFPPGPISLEYGDCFRARWTPEQGGEFTDLRYAGHCRGEPQAQDA